MADNLLDGLSAFLDAVTIELEEADIYPRRVALYPFDTVALTLVSKSLRLSRACLLLLTNGFDEEAFGLSRSVTECAVILRFMTQSHTDLHSKALLYIGFSDTYRAFWKTYIKDDLKELLTPADILALSDDSKRKAFRKAFYKHWSGHGSGFVLDAVTKAHRADGLLATEEQRLFRNALEYSEASQHVHCSLPSVDPVAADQCSVYRVPQRVRYHRGARIGASRTILQNVYDAVVYLYFGLELTSSRARLEAVNRLQRLVLEGFKITEIERSITMSR